MTRIKRSQTDTIVDYNNNYKKIKFDHFTSVNQSRSFFGSLLEHLPNETLYEIFDYLDITHAYDAFFDLNSRFQKLFLHSNLPIKVNISTMSKSTFERYHTNVIIPNQHRISYLRLSNPFTVDRVFSPPRIISKFVRLQTLILDHIKAKYLENIFIHLSFLSDLQSLSIHLIDPVKNTTLFYLQIFRLRKLKYCRMEFESENDREVLLFIGNETSSIEHLVIKNHFQFPSFQHLLAYLPRLRYLSIDYIDGSAYSYANPSPMILTDLKYVSLKLNLIGLDELEKLVKNFFRSIEHFRLTSRYDPGYLDAKRWEDLIVCHMPNLRIFDFNHDGSTQFGSSSYHDLVKQFNSSFWTTRKWFFTHQHDWQGRLDSGVLHSTDPYRRKDFTFYWNIPELLCSHTEENHVKSIKHVRIGGKHANISPGNYFPNARELTLKNHFTIPDTYLPMTLNRVVPLQQLTKLMIDYYDFPFEQIVHLIRFTPQLHTLKIYLLSINRKAMIALQENPFFREVSSINRIKHLEVNDRCSFEQIEMFVQLCPNLEYLKIGMKRKETRAIVRYLLTKNNPHTRHLYCLCISQTPRVCLGEMNLLLTSEELRRDYSIKWIQRDLYLWW